MNVDIFNTNNKYSVIYCDPAWQFSNKKTGGSMSSSAQDQYRVTSLDDMKKLPVSELAENDCALIMWWVGSMPQEAIDLCKSWGFKLQNMNGIVWRKLTVKGLPFFGMGFTTRAGSESCIVAYRGKQSNLVKNRNVRAAMSPMCVPPIWWLVQPLSASWVMSGSTPCISVLLFPMDQ